MTVEVILHCDGPDCQTFAQAGPLTDEWFVVHTASSEPKHFCDGWCAMRWFATWAEPPIVIEQGP